MNNPPRMDNLTELLEAMSLELYDTGNIEIAHCVTALGVMIRRMHTAQAALSATLAELEAEENRVWELRSTLTQLKSWLFVADENGTTRQDFIKRLTFARAMIDEALGTSSDESTRPMEVFDGYGT